MSPIRIGLIGLSANAKTSWAANAHLPYLLSSQNEYIIEALCNTSVGAATTAIEAFGLPLSTKAYGNPVDLANDSNVDLVVCNTRVDVHYETIKPSLLKGKQVYCEWPLAHNIEAVTELANIAKDKRSRTMIGLQGHVSPIVLALKSLIEGGRIGKVLSSSAVICGGSRTRDTLIEGLRYFTEKKVGGNPVTIGLGHAIDSILDTLGELSSFRTQCSLQRPEVGIVDSDGKVVETVISDVPDHVLLQGKLLAHSDAPLSIAFRRGQPFKNSPGLVWSIHGEQGEIMLTSTAGSIQANDADAQINLHDFAKDTVEMVQVERRYVDLPIPARNVAAMYDAFANKENKSYPDFQHALMRHRMVADIFRSSVEDVRATYL